MDGLSNLSPDDPEFERRLSEEWQYMHEEQMPDFIFDCIDREKNSAVIRINPSRMLRYLHDQGFRVHQRDEANIIVRCQQNIVEPYTVEQLVRFLYDTAKAMPETLPGCSGCTREDLLNEMDTKIHARYISNYNTRLDNLNFQPFQATAHTQAFYYRNCVVLLEGKKGLSRPTILDYSEITWHVWREAIIEHDFTLEPPEDYKDCDIDTFINRLSGLDTIEGVLNRGDGTIERRKKYLRTLIGYLLHTYKNPANARAVILMDLNLTENPEGGSGKGLFIQAISKMRTTVTLDGKTFDPEDNFLWQNVNESTEIVAIDDAKEKFPFEYLFSVITEPWTVAKKFQTPFIIPFSRSPKVVITTNYTVEGDAGSHKRRKYEVEVSGYYSKNRTPQEDLGRLMFTEWDTREWNRFYNYMIACTSTYLAEGVVEAESIFTGQKKFLQAVGESWIQFLDEFVEDWDTDQGGFTSSDVVAKLNDFKMAGRYTDLKSYNPIWMGRLLKKYEKLYYSDDPPPLKNTPFLLPNGVFFENGGSMIRYHLDRHGLTQKNPLSPIASKVDQNQYKFFVLCKRKWIKEQKGVKREYEGVRGSNEGVNDENDCPF